jgi:DNA oxidative demethylase
MKAPKGLIYIPDFLSAREQTILIRKLRTLRFGKIRMHGIIARREVLHFGMGYGYDRRVLEKAPPVPRYLTKIRARLAAEIGIKPADFKEVLVTHYPVGAPIGWHRDAAVFGDVAGISLLSPCPLRMKRDKSTYEITLEPGSAYFLTGEARWEWYHHIPPMKAPRYSITFRVLKR